MPKVKKNIKNLRKKFCEFPPLSLKCHIWALQTFVGEIERGKQRTRSWVDSANHCGTSTLNKAKKEDEMMKKAWSPRPKTS